MAEDDVNRQLSDSQKELARLGNEINKLAGATSKKQLKQLKKLKIAYAKQSDTVKVFTKQLKALRTEKTHLTKVAEQLTSKFGGSAATITKFTGGLKDATCTVDDTTGKMQVLGMSTGMSAKTFNVWTASIQLAIAVTTAFLDWMDKLEKKQGTLQRSVGMAGVSIGASQRTLAKGWGIAGKAGEKAAGELTEIIAQSRKGLWEDLVGEKGELPGMDKLVTMTTGMSTQVPQWAKMLSETFAETSGQGMLDSMMKIGLVAHQSNVPVDQFGNMIFDLAKEFVHLGIDVDDATAALGTFVDEMGEGAIKPAVGMAAMRNILQQQTTAAGLQGRFMTAAFSSQNFEGLDTTTQNLLNNRAKGITKNPNASWQSLDVGQQATTLKSLDPGQYAQVMRGLYKFLKTMPELIQTAIAPQVIGMEMATASEFWDNLKIDEDIGEKLAAQMETPTDTFKTAVEQFAEHIKENSRLQQEFYSGLMKQLHMGQANFAETFNKERAEGSTVIGAGATAWGSTMTQEWARDAQEAEEDLRQLDKNDPNYRMKRLNAKLKQEGAAGNTIEMKAMANIISFFTPDASKIVAPGGTALNSMTKLVPGTQIGEEGIIETEAGVFKIIYEGPSEGIEGKRQLDHALPGSRRN